MGTRLNLLLSIVAAGKTLSEMRQIYFRVKDEIYAHPRAGFAFNTKGLERILLEVLGDTSCMNDVKTPK